MLACESFDGEHVWHTGERFRRMLNKGKGAFRRAWAGRVIRMTFSASCQ
jgi:hypothetical protein